MSKNHPKLPYSLRKYVREKKSEIRKKYGEQSPQMEKLLAWAAQRKREKLQRVDKAKESL